MPAFHGCPNGWRPGFCGITQESLPSSSQCKAHELQGSWSGVQCANECKALCRGCPRCSRVSFSSVDGDCSWFSSSRCKLGALRTHVGSVETGHCTSVVNRTDGPTQGTAGLCKKPPPPAPPPKVCSLTDSWTFECPSSCGERCDGIAAVHRNATVGLQLQQAMLAHLRGGTGTVDATWTTTAPPFVMAIAAAQASEVSKQIGSRGQHEPKYTNYWRALTQECCASGGVVLDVGSNIGYFSLFSARLGCRVHAWEPVAKVADYLDFSATLNGLKSRITLHRAVASDDDKRRPVSFHQAAHWDISSVGGVNSYPGLQVTKNTVVSEWVDDVPLNERPCAMKMDVEGFEPHAMRGARRLFREQPPRMLLLEYTPGALERAAARGDEGALDSYAGFAGMLRFLLECGYRIFLLDAKSKHSATGTAFNVSQLQHFEEVVAQTVEAEAQNAERMKAAFASRRGFYLPTDLHPHSLRAQFKYNTDLLALHGAHGQPSAGIVGGGRIPLFLKQWTRVQLQAWAKSANLTAALSHLSLPQVKWIAAGQRLNGAHCWWSKKGCFFRASSRGGRMRSPIGTEASYT